MPNLRKGTECIKNSSIRPQKSCRNPHFEAFSVSWRTYQRRRNSVSRPQTRGNFRQNGQSCGRKWGKQGAIATLGREQTHHAESSNTCWCVGEHTQERLPPVPFRGRNETQVKFKIYKFKITVEDRRCIPIGVRHSTRQRLCARSPAKTCFRLDSSPFRQ